MGNDINGVSKSGLPKITDVNKSRRVEGEERPAAERGGERPAGNETVALTDGARLLERVEGQLAETPVVDVQKVEAVKAEIADGSYQVDDRVIAEKLVQSDRERG
ncbi:MAG: flagellar biosynthesis anti-sigma factor FlgM [Pseudomonadota bacterium]